MELWEGRRERGVELVTVCGFEQKEGSDREVTDCARGCAAHSSSTWTFRGFRLV